MTSVLSVKAVREALQAAPLCVIDVGAAGGIQKYLIADDAADCIKYFGFEPNPDNFAQLQDSGDTRYFQLALSNRVGEADFFAHRTVGSLVRRVDRERALGERYDTIKVQVESLGNLREQGILPGLDLVKSDAERHDFEVLDGAGAYGKELLCAIAEFEYYNTADGNGFARIDDLLTRNGLIFFSVSQKSGPLGELAGGDLLYLKDIGALLRQETDDSRRRQQVLKLIVIATMLNFLRYAYVVTRVAGDAGVLTDDEVKALLACIEDRVFLPGAVPRLGVRQRLSQLLSLLAQLVIGPSWGAKSAPRDNRIMLSSRMFARSGRVPASWRRRHREYLERHYRTYLGHQGVFFERPAE